MGLVPGDLPVISRGENSASSRFHEFQLAGSLFVNSITATREGEEGWLNKLKAYESEITGIFSQVMKRQEARKVVVIFSLFLMWLTAAEAQTNYQRIKSFGPFSEGVN